MAFIKWQEEFLTGITKVDEQHRKLLDILNDVHFLLHTQLDKEKIKEIIFSLNNYIIEHFTTEEELMKEKRKLIPKDLYQKHISEHRFFVDKIQEFTSMLEIEINEGNTSEYLLDLFSFLGDWFTHHILEIDKQTFQYIK